MCLCFNKKLFTKKSNDLKEEKPEKHIELVSSIIEWCLIWVSDCYRLIFHLAFMKNHCILIINSTFVLKKQSDKYRTHIQIRRRIWLDLIPRQYFAKRIWSHSRIGESEWIPYYFHQELTGGALKKARLSPQKGDLLIPRNTCSA